MTKYSSRNFFTIVRVVAIGLFGISATMGIAAASDSIYVNPGRLVDVGGHRLNMYCEGRGAPTVVFDSGDGDWSPAWALVQPSVAKTTRTCSYDRAGYGFSDPGPMPRTSGQAVSELHALLQRSGEKGPFILVGHSLGGMNARLFADKYPDEVAGIVLVDSAHEDQMSVIPPALVRLQDEAMQQMAACALSAEHHFADAKPGQKDLCISLQTGRAAALSRPLAAQLRREAEQPNGYKTAVSEYQSFAASASELRQARRSFGEMPIRILTAGAHLGDPAKLTADQRREDAQFEKIWDGLQRSWLRLSSNAEQIRLPQSSHYIQFDDPRAVIDAIQSEIGVLKAPAPSQTRAQRYRRR